MDIIPAIDIIDGKCVRLSKGDFSTRKVYNEDPLEVARQFQDAGLARLHLVDLDGAKQGKIVNYAVLEKIASRTMLVIDAGGGIKSDEDVRIVFECGASMITAGSIAIKNPETARQWIKQYGAGKVFLGADVKDNFIAVSGWQEKSETKLDEFLDSWLSEGYQTVICTDISRDGMLQGPATELYKSMLLRFPEMNLIASGGVSKIADLEELSGAGIHATIIGKAIYENRIRLAELTKFLIHS
jgi:phosphoribosylformimino-5-aminoimidazole carboxamide ribotide isomerase